MASRPTTAGDLRERVVFEKRGRQSDGGGNFGTAWGSPVSMAARIQSLRGGEAVMADRLQGRQPFIITVRSCMATRAVTSAWRARNERTGVIYNITSVAPDESGAFIDVLATAGEAEG